MQIKYQAAAGGRMRAKQTGVGCYEATNIVLGSAAAV